jgi:hypothetical protein
VAVQLEVSGESTLVLEGAGNGMGNWGAVRFGGCAESASPTSPPTPVPATPTQPPAAPSPGPAAPATAILHGVFDDANLHDASRFEATIKDLRARGFGAIMLTNGWAARMNELLTVSDRLGFDVYMGPLGELYDHYYRDSAKPATVEAARAAVGAVIDGTRGHPSHKGWYRADEPDLGLSDKVARVADVIRERDPGKPITTALIGVNRAEAVGTAVGVNPWLIDVYPAAAGNAECDFTMRGFGYHDRDFVSYTREVSDGRPSGTPIWMVLQGHQFTSGGFSLRYPTQQEMRAQARLARQEGASAIFWFLYSSAGHPLGPGLKDTPALLDEATRIVNGTESGPACESSPTAN